MNLHEYQAKQLLQRYAVPIPRGIVAADAEAAVVAAEQLGGNTWMIKAQVHAGGRGKAGGVKRAETVDDIRRWSTEMIGSKLVTLQNAPQGQLVNQVLIEETLPIAQELYLSLLVDRAAERVVVVASNAGGMEIEEIAHDAPSRILRTVCDPLLGLMDYQVRDLAFGLGLNGQQIVAFSRLLNRLYKLFKDNDLALLEINPLVVTDDGVLVTLDCKMSIDDNALRRQQALAEERDWSQDDVKEVDAHAAGLNYIALDGNIGCMVNGAGLAMATMDLIQLHGGRPANFLDVGGGATAEMVAKAFKIILSDRQVKAILVNIFGGIMRCDIIAEGIIKAVREVGVKVPVVVRLEGTNVEAGRGMLRDSGLSIISADGLTDAAKRAVAAVNQDSV